MIGAILLPVLVLAAVALFGQQDTATAAISTTTIATATMPAAPAPKPVAPVTPAVKPVATSPGVPVFDVNSLPTARRR